MQMPEMVNTYLIEYEQKLSEDALKIVIEPLGALY